LILRNHSVLVTGSEGLIGKELSRKLEEKKINFVGYDIKNGQDILDQESLEKIICNIDGVIHLAAISRVVAGYNDPYKAVVTNVIGTTNILDLIRRKNPSCWMIFGSSREVYGEYQRIVKESDPQKPVNVYGASKSAGEYLSLCYGNNYNLRTFVVRFSNVYGGLNDHPDRVIPRFFIQALANSDITVYGGNQIFDFVHLSDAVDGLVKLIQKIINNEKLEYRTLHFVTGKSLSLVELSNKIIKLTNSKSIVKYLPRREFDVDTFIGDPSVTMNALDWQPKISIDEGLESYLKLIKR
jgi:nucleoside-diphosphate-sugar epimerase